MTGTFHKKQVLSLMIISLNIVAVVLLAKSANSKLLPRLFSFAQEPKISNSNLASAKIKLADSPFNDFVVGKNAQANVGYSPNTIIIKLRGTARSQVDKKLGLQAKQLSTTGVKSLDNLNRKYKVKYIEPLIPALKTLQLKTNKNDTQLFEQLKNKYSARTKRALAKKTTPSLADYYLVTFENLNKPVTSVLEDYKKDQNIDLAELNYIYKTFGLPNDTYVDPSGAGVWKKGNVSQDFEDMWGLKKIGYESAWNQGVITQGNTIVVAVIDTGVDKTHADIASNIWKNNGEVEGNSVDDDNNGFVDDAWGWNFVSKNNDPDDDVGHGTHVAGTIAVATNNSLGVAGMSPQSKIMIVKGLGPFGGTTSDLVQAIYYSVNNGADVLNNSWGGKGISSTLADAVNYAQNAGAAVVAAAGNSNDDASLYMPAGIGGVFTVAASSPYDYKSTFSNWGDTVEVSAPGESTLSLRAKNTTLGRVIDNDYIVASGTSMASPHTAGLVALLIGYSKTNNFGWTLDEIYHRIMKGSDNVNGNNYDVAGKIGAGRIHITGALSASSSSDIRYHSVVVNSGGDRYLDSGEEASLVVSLKNYWQNADGVTATLTSETQGVEIVNGTAQFGNISENAVVSNSGNPYIIRIGSGMSAMSNITLRLVIQGANSYTRNEQLIFSIGKPAKLVTALTDEDNVGESSGDGDGIVEAKEKAEVVVELYNPSSTPARNITLKLATTQNTSIIRSESSIDIIGGNASKRNNANPFIIQAPPDFTIGKTLFFTLTVFVDNEKVFTAPVVLKSDANFNYYSLGDSWYSDVHQLEPAVTEDASQAKYAVWRDSRYHVSDGDILFAKSTDKGQSFTNPVVVNTINGYMNTMPRVVVGSDGAIYVAWIYVSESNTQSFDVYISKSTDGGKTFSQPKSIIGPNRALYSRYEPAVKIEVFGNNVYLSWADEREGSDKSKVYFARSSDKGDSFQITTPTNQLYQGAPDITVNSSNVIFLTYEYNRKLTISRSDDNGATFSSGKFVAETTTGYQYWSQVKTIGQNSVYIIFAQQDGPGFNFDYIVKSVDGGQTFGQPLKIDSILHGWSQDRPALGAASENDVSVVFSEITSDGLSYYQSNNSGASFGPREVLALSNLKDFTNWTNYVENTKDSTNVYWDEYVSDNGKIKTTLATRAVKDQVLHMQEGWNFLALAVNPNNPLTAAGLLSQAQASGVVCKSVARYTQGQWAYYPAVSTDYPIESYKGYFVQCLNSGDITVTGRAGAYDFSKIGLSSTGWYSISLPVSSSMTAQNFCDESKARFPGTTAEIDRWINGGWDGHVCGLPFNDFSIETGKGYFVKHQLAGETASVLSGPH